MQCYGTHVWCNIEVRSGVSSMATPMEGLDGAEIATGTPSLGSQIETRGKRVFQGSYFKISCQSRLEFVCV